MPPPSLLHKVLLATSLMQFALLCAAAPLLAHQIEELPSLPTLKSRQGAGSTIPITGITDFGIRPRLEIRQLEQNADQWNIYLLGLARFQATNESDELSWYHIAGIHGRPYVPWDNVQSAPGVDSPGYCMHVSNLFLPWHRPYVALFEQTLYQHIIDAVNSFPAGAVRQRYAAAALSWRAPYWDWAAVPPVGQSVFPTSVTTPTVTVTMPNGTLEIPNPLYSYEFHPVKPDDFYFNPFASWNVTMRFPTSWNQDATPQDNLVGPVLDNSRVSFQDRLYNLFTNYNNFTQFSSEAWYGPDVANADSLESIHDAIHSITGSNGHMTYLDYSAYDPILIFAMWQAIYNDSYVEPMDAIEQTFTIAVGQQLDENSPLSPFHSDANGDFWTPASVRSIGTLGYTYADLGNGSVSAVKAAVNSLYGNSAASGGLSKRSTKIETASKREVPGAASPDATAPEEIDNGKYRQYLANIMSQKFALNGSYAIYVFMGDFDDTPSAWALSPNLVGTHAVFATLSGADATDSPQLRRRKIGSPLQVTGTMPLTSMLLAKVEAGELPCMDLETVVPYLTDNLEWRVGMFDGTQVPVGEVADLTITVVGAEVEPAAAADQFPRWGDFTELTTITQGKPGGCA
ncbi:hypothetical protein LTR08_004696 [Meristemomyces frigidus]|nr:hypothetical protein LTR08_004696 [Meristemomyces frigidus]